MLGLQRNGFSDIQLGEAFSSSIINAVMHSPLWEKSALFFTYDEHGGYYDHVAPPAAIAPDSIAPRITVPPDQPGAFDRYGMRVPGFVISPFAKANYVSSVVHDHTSILKFVETKWNLEAMTFRDANADDLLDCFDFDAVAFREPPTLASPGVPKAGSSCSAVALPPTAPIVVPPTDSSTTTTTTLGGAVSSTTLLNLAASLGPDETAPPRFGTNTGDGVPTALPATGSSLDRLATAGGLAALGGLAVVLAAQEKARRAAEGPET